MQQRFISLLLILAATFSLFSCRKKIKEQADDLYSRHLQTKIKIQILATPDVADAKEVQLIIMNDGQEAGKWRIKQITDSLFQLKQIQPVVIVAVQAHHRMNEYGIAGKPDFMHRGDKADHYSNFVINELLPFIKKQSGIRSFQKTTIMGSSLGGLSAFDIAWNNGDKIDQVGVFSGSFWWRDKDTNDSTYRDEKNRIAHNMIKSSRKRPHLKYWFYTGEKEETSDRDRDGLTDVVDDTKDLIMVLETKKFITASDIAYVQSPTGKHDEASWSAQLPAFLLWAIGK